MSKGTILKVTTEAQIWSVEKFDKEIMLSYALSTLRRLQLVLVLYYNQSDIFCPGDVGGL